MKTIKREIIETLLSSKKVLISAHVNPDGDSLGSQLGIARFLSSRNIDHELINEGVIPGSYGFMPGIDRIRNVDELPSEGEAGGKPGGFDTAIILECSSLDRIGKVRDFIGDDCQIINIDHHSDNTPYGMINWKNPEASAVGEMIYDLLVDSSITVDREMAVNLYTAILTDTGRFHFSNTSPRCLRVAADLVELGADPEQITEQVYFNQRRQLLHLTGLVLSGMQYYLDGRLCLMELDRETMQKADAGKADTEGLVNNSMRVAGVKVGILLSEIDGKNTKVSLRSQGECDVAAIAAVYGGGGHRNASGCTLDLPLKQAREAIIKQVGDRLNGSL